MASSRSYVKSFADRGILPSKEKLRPGLYYRHPKSRTEGHALLHAGRRSRRRSGLAVRGVAEVIATATTITEWEKVAQESFLLLHLL